MSEVLSAFITL